MRKWGHQIRELKGNIPGARLYGAVTNFLAAQYRMKSYGTSVRYASMDIFYSCENNEKQLGAVICPQHSCSSLRHFCCQVYIPARSSAWMVAFRVPASSDILAPASAKSQLFKLSAALCTGAAGKWSCSYVKPSLALGGSRQKWHGDNFFTYHVQTYQTSLVRSVRHHRK